MPTLTTLVTFDGSDGDSPVGALVEDASGDLFGATLGGPTGGEVFEIANGSAGYASTPIVLVGFDKADGLFPTGNLIADAAGDLLGTTSLGGPNGESESSNGDGEVFEIAKTASGYAATPTILASFDDSTGYEPTSGVVADAAGNLYGTTIKGGSNGEGAVFEIAKTGTGYASAPTTLASIDNGNTTVSASGLFADANGDLFGTVSTIVFRSTEAGTAFEIAKTGENYASTTVELAPLGDQDAGPPPSGMIADAAGDLFGEGNGDDVFEIAKTATGYASAATTLATFTGAGGMGEDPTGGLLADSAGDLFGVTAYGGLRPGFGHNDGYGNGVVFEIAKTATGYAAPTILASFDGDDGYAPMGGLIADAAGDLIGTTLFGPSNDDGTVFELSGVAFHSLAITSAGEVTSQISQTITGTIDAADAGLTVSIHDGSTLLATATPNASGDWSASVDLLSRLGPQSITARATDATGVVLTSAPVVYQFDPAFTIDVVTPGPGATVTTGNGYVKLFDLSGDDTLQGGSGLEALHVTHGNNLLEAGSGPNTLVGGSGDDTLIGGGQSRLVGGGGNDKMFGGLTPGAADTLVGGSGDDTISVYMGANRLVAGAGHDTLRGGSGDDTLVGGAALTARLVAGSGNQRLVGGSGSDRLIGGSGDDTMVSGTGSETIRGGSGTDTVLVGTKGDDTITAGSGSVTVYSSQVSSDLSSEFETNAGYLQITFTNAQVLLVKGVQVDIHAA